MNINEIESKEELITLLNKGIDKFGVTKKDINESYANGSISNIKKNKTRIRLLSQNEAILKLMVPYGDKTNVVSYYDYPLLQSENKYSMSRCVIYDNISPGYTHGSISVRREKINSFRNTSENQITILNNYFLYASGNTNNCGFLAQNSQWRCYPIRADGYGTLFQDNYEDKPEIRCRSYIYCNPNLEGGLRYMQDYYNKNGNASGTVSTDISNAWGDYYINGNGNTVVTTYKTSTRQYQGFLPVMNI